MREALVLAGGLGTRLGDLAGGRPKSLVDVGGRPFVDLLVWNLARNGFHRLVFSLGVHGEQFSDYLEKLSLPGLPAVEIVCRIEPEPLGTGGALRFAGDTLTGDDFLVVNGDTLFDFNYLDLTLFRRLQEAAGALALRRVPDAGRYGAVALGAGVAGGPGGSPAGGSADGRDAGLVTAFAEKQAGGPGLVSGGVTAFSSEVLDLLPPGVSSLERDLLPRLVADGSLAGREYGGYFIDIGTPESLQTARTEIPRWRAKPAVLLDRDGVLNVDAGHVHTPEQFEWMPGAPEAVRWLNDNGFLVFVITNQAGIAKGYYSEADYQAFEGWISSRLAEWGAHLDATYHCPHHPDGLGEYRQTCACRKPAPGMILQAAAEWDLDPVRTVLLGNSESDVRAADAAGVRGLLLAPGERVDDAVRRAVSLLG